MAITEPIRISTEIKNNEESKNNNSISTEEIKLKINELENELTKTNQIFSAQIRSLRRQLDYSEKTADIADIEKRREETLRQYINEEYKNPYKKISEILSIVAIFMTVILWIYIFINRH